MDTTSKHYFTTHDNEYRCITFFTVNSKYAVVVGSSSVLCDSLEEAQIARNQLEQTRNREREQKRELRQLARQQQAEQASFA